MSLRHVWAVTLKELRHIRRDRATLNLVLFTPVALLFLLAYAVTAEIRQVPAAVVDLDRSPTSRTFIQQVTVGDDLELISQVSSIEEIENLLLRNKIKAAFIIPPSFENSLLSLRSFPLQVVIDGTEPQSGGFALEHISRRATEFAGGILADQLQLRGIPLESLEVIDLRIRTWYNPSLKANVDLIPGLISMVLALPGMTVALTMAREREHGTFEQLLATPIKRAELLLGKMNPYIIAGIANMVLTTIVAIVWFDVPFRGSFPIYLLLSIAFFYSVLSVGMLIGVFVRTQPAAMAISLLVLFLPGLFLTGVFFPIASMPPIVRLEALSLPGSHFAIVTRGIFTTGVGLNTLWPYGLTMLAMGVAFTAIAALFFRKKLG